MPDDHRISDLSCDCFSVETMIHKNPVAPEECRKQVKVTFSGAAESGKRQKEDDVDVGWLDLRGFLNESRTGLKRLFRLNTVDRFPSTSCLW